MGKSHPKHKATVITLHGERKMLIHCYLDQMQMGRPHISVDGSYIIVNVADTSVRKCTKQTYRLETSVN